MRLELIHATIVHYPIALLSIGILFRIAAIWIKKPKYSFLLPSAWTLLLLGVIFSWVAVIDGLVAADIVRETIKNLDILDKHIAHAFIASIGFSVALSLDWIRANFFAKFQKKHQIVKKGLVLGIWFLYLFSLTNLVLTGYYGVELVYEQGVGVHKI